MRCRYAVEVCEYEEEIDLICDFNRQYTKQATKPDWEREKHYCCWPEECEDYEEDK